MSSASASTKSAACTIFLDGERGREPLGMKGTNLESAVKFSTRKISISNLFFAILANFVESGGDVKADSENAPEVKH